MLNSVIVVDDEASIRTAIEQWLDLSGFEVQLFSRAEECLAQLPRDFPGSFSAMCACPASVAWSCWPRSGPGPGTADHSPDGARRRAHGRGSHARWRLRLPGKTLQPQTLLNSLRRALDKRALVLENRRLHQQADSRAKLDATLLGASPPCRPCAARYWNWPPCR